MVSKVAGRAEVNFTDDKGREVRGTTLYLLHSDERVEGQKAEKVFVKQGMADGVSPGDTVNVSFDMRGRVDEISKDTDAAAPGTTLKLNK